MADNQESPGSSAAPQGPDLDDPQQLLDAVREVALRLLAGGVPKSTIAQLQRLLRDNVGDVPWREMTRRILAEPADHQRLVQQGLAAQRDWIWRGGRETPGPSVGRRAKGCLARLVAQAIFLSIWAVLIVLALLALRHRFPDFQIYWLLDWLYEQFPQLRR
jgi:hypothetical protein